MQMTARQKQILGGNQYLPCSSDGDGTVHRKVEDEKEEAVFWDWFREVIRLFSSYKQTLTYWQKSGKGYREPGGAPVLDLFLVPGPKVRANWFPLSFVKIYSHFTQLLGGESQNKLSFFLCKNLKNNENLCASYWWVILAEASLFDLPIPLKLYFYEGWWLLMAYIVSSVEKVAKWRETQKMQISYLNKRTRNNS